MPAFLPFRVAVICSVLAYSAVAAGCGASDEIQAAAAVGEPLVLELGDGVPSSRTPLPEGASIVGGRLEWTPSPEQEGEHLLALDGANVRVNVASAEPSIEYGGCECGPKPQPPRPKAEALGVVLLAAYFRRRRRLA